MPGVGPHERGTGRGAGRGQVDELLGDVDAHDLDAPTGEGVGVAPRSAADVEHVRAGMEPEGGDEELDLLLGAAGERVSEVGGPGVAGDGLEPVGIAARAATAGRPTQEATPASACGRASPSRTCRR